MSSVIIYTLRIIKRYFTCGEYIRTLRLQASLTRFGGICEAVITGLTRKKLGFVTISALQSLVNSHFFGILSEVFWKTGRQFSIKIPWFKNVYSCIIRGISPVANIPSPCAWQASLSIFGRGMRSGFKSCALEPLLTGLCIYDANYCIIYAEVSKRS